jgi:anti-sigma B factor antagonist
VNAPTTTALRLDGDVTVQFAAEHKILLLSALEAAQALELDLSGVIELDAAGLQLLLLLKREATNLGKTLRLRTPSGAVLEILALARLDLHLEPVPTEAQRAGIDPQGGAR